MEDIVLNDPVIIDDDKFTDESALLELLVELKGDSLFDVFIGKYSQWFTVYLFELTPNGYFTMWHYIIIYIKLTLRVILT